MLFPALSPDKMKGVPQVRKDLKQKLGLVALDRALAKKWTDECEENATYRREVPLEQLQAEAKSIALTYELPKNIIEPVPMRARLRLNYDAVKVTFLKGELMCHLPLFLLAATCASSKAWSFLRLNLDLLLVTLLPPFRVSQETIKCISEENQVEAPASSVDSVVALLRAGKPAISDNDKRYFLRVLSRSEFGDTGPSASDFEGRLRGISAPELNRVQSLLRRRELFQRAVTPPPCFKHNGALLKGNTVAALLGVFSDNALRILAYLGSYADSLGGGAQAGEVLHSFPNGGSPAAMFVLGPLMMSEELRRRANWVAPQLGTRANPLPRNGVSGFNSVLSKPAVYAAEAAANA